MFLLVDAYCAFIMFLLSVRMSYALRIPRVLMMSTVRHQQSYYDASSPLQKIFTTLASADPIQPSQPEISQELKHCLQYMSSVSLDDLGFKGYKFNKQVCVNIAQHGNFHIAAFLLPKGKLLPIHDHPKMAVCSKLIGGELKVRSFTTTSSEPLSPKAKTCIDVELSEDSIKTPADDAWVISSTKNNYHEFTALSDCVILDVLIPPYAYPERTCTYYSAEATSVPFHNAGEVKSASDKSRKVTGQVSYKSSNVHERPLYTLEVVPEEVVFRKYGLPVAVKYNGYVPSLPPN